MSKRIWIRLVIMIPLLLLAAFGPELLERMNGSTGSDIPPGCCRTRGDKRRMGPIDC